MKNEIKVGNIVVIDTKKNMGAMALYTFSKIPELKRHGESTYLLKA